MTQTKQAKDIDLRYLINNYGIQLVLDELKRSTMGYDY